MNVLFLLKGLEMGGVEVVTSVLAQKFKAEGHNVYIFALMRGNGSALARFPKGIDVTVGVGVNNGEENVSLLRKVLEERKIEVVVNQWALPYAPIKTLDKARKGLNVKVISVYHNDPLSNGRIQGVDMQLTRTNNQWKRTLLDVQKWMYCKVTSRCMSYTYHHSDKFIVLSESFIKNFEAFTGIKNPDHLIVQTNPVTLSNDGFEYKAEKKQKEIIYVGRVDYTQKRVHRIIDVWRHLEHNHPEWRLTIVGDGEERENVEHQVRDLELERVSFEGFQQPQPYYERASILILASEFEGFPLVLAECMSYGVVPVVLDSYAAAKDIVHDGKNGLLVPYDKAKGFESDLFAERLETLLNDQTILNKMALEAIETSKEYSIDNIYKEWKKVFAIV